MPQAVPKKKGSSNSQKVMTPVETEFGVFEVDSGKYEVSRATGPDPRDPRMVGEPCLSNHLPAKPGKGSPSGSNGWATWIACSQCQLRLLYVPAYGAHALSRAAGPLAADLKEKIQDLGPQARGSAELKEKKVGLDAAENSMVRRLDAIRNQKALLEGRAKSSEAARTPETLKVTPAPKALAPPKELPIENEMSNTPGRKSRKPEASAEELEYNERNSEGSWRAVSPS